MGQWAASPSSVRLGSARSWSKRNKLSRGRQNRGDPRLEQTGANCANLSGSGRQLAWSAQLVALKTLGQPNANSPTFPEASSSAHQLWTVCVEQVILRLASGGQIGAGQSRSPAHLAARHRIPSRRLNILEEQT